MDQPDTTVTYLRILVAEDNLINQKVVRLILGRLGFESKIVTNGKEALAESVRNPYDVILMDDNMPEMDGVTAASAIHKYYTDSPSPYIVAMTANTIPGDRERYLSLGMDDYISKPLRNDELRIILNRVSAGKSRK